MVGASYVALECAGFLRGLGFDTSLMARSIFLRGMPLYHHLLLRHSRNDIWSLLIRPAGFDQQIAEMIGAYMASPVGVKIIRPAIPTRVEKSESGRLKVPLLSRNSRLRGYGLSLAQVYYKHDGSQEEKVDEYDTVIWAIGRNPETTVRLPSLRHILSLVSYDSLSLSSVVLYAAF